MTILESCPFEEPVGNYIIQSKKTISEGKTENCDECGIPAEADSCADLKRKVVGSGRGKL